MKAAATPIRVGLIIPSSNVTVETELPALLAQHRTAGFTFHSSRMRMQAVSEEALLAMNAQRERCVAELTDASCEAFVYGCLVALMAQGPGEHRRVIAALGEQLRDRERSRWKSRITPPWHAFRARASWLPHIRWT